MSEHLRKIMGIAALGFPLFLSAQSLYKCTDSNGEVHFTNTKPRGQCKDLVAEAEKTKAKEKKERRQLIGKTSAELRKRVGAPDRVVESVSAFGTVEKWIYKYQTIVIVNGKVTEVISVE